jgi:DNA-binding transcriptional LysR family regulator
MDFDLTRLRQIVAIARTRSFSRAAEDLHITQPAISRSVAGFEQRLGFRLFDRDRAGVTPTAMGKLVIAEAERVLRAARDLEHNLRLYARGESGELAIGMGPLLAMLLPGIARHMLEVRPGVHLRASIRTPDHLVQELLDDRIELIFGNSWLIRDVPDLAIQPIGTMTLAFIVRSAHPLAQRSTLQIEDLAAFPQAGVGGPGVGAPGSGAGAFTCDNYHVLRDLVMETDCIWLACPIALKKDVAEDRLVSLDVADFRQDRSEVALVSRRGRTLSPPALEMARHLQNLLASNQPLPA